MSRWTRLIPMLAVSVLLAACGQESGDSPLAPEGPRTNAGGWTVGGTATGTGGQETKEPTTSADVVPSDTTSRGGGWTVGGT
jgi:hypothetical protein